jgi:hypothetical protein
VVLDDMLEEAHREAVRTETRDDVRAALHSWTDLRRAVTETRPAHR